MSSETPLTIGFIGAGKVVENMHLSCLKKLGDKFQIKGFADKDEDKARALCEKAGQGRPYPSFAAMKADNPSLDMVTVATKPYITHQTCAIEALHAGCHVYVEKPFTVTLEGAREMFRVAEEQGRTLCAYQNRRYEVAFLVFKQSLEDAVLGDPLVIRRRITCGKEPKDLLNMGSHIIDQMICLTDGEVPTEVSAVVQNPQCEYDGPAGFFKLQLRYKDGKIGEIEMLPNAGSQSNYFYVAGSNGSFTQDWADNMADLFRKNMKLNGNDAKWLPSTFQNIFPDIFQDGGSLYYHCYEAIYDHIVNGAPPPVPKRHTLLQLALVEAMFASAREGRTLPFQW